MFFYTLLPVACVGVTLGRPPTWRSNAFPGTVFLQNKRARASNARPYNALFQNAKRDAAFAASLCL